ncbi:uncharacterized protein RB166_001108 [Leptodactylus fuscus]
MQVREVKAAVMGSVTITFNYDTYRYQNLISSWCRQVSMTECENIVDTSVSNHKRLKERVFISQNTERIGVVNVTMVNLQHWDTGLYKWRIWIGTEYNIIENVMLQVVVGLPTNLHVAIIKAYDTLEMNCVYNQRQKWSKAWYKVMDHDKLQWLVHSDGNVNMDYSSRTIVFINKQNRALVMKMANLELWDSGLYQCREAGGETVLNEILLLVTVGKKHFRPIDVKANVSNGENSNYTVEGRNEHNKSWDILRWILFLCMGLFVLLFSYYEKISDNLSHIHLMYNRSLNKT